MSNGNGYDARGEDQRIERLVDENETGCKRRVGAIERDVINLGAELSATRRDISAMHQSVNGLRHSHDLEIEGVKKSLAAICAYFGVVVPS